MGQSGNAAVCPNLTQMCVYRPTAGGFSRTDKSRQNTTKMPNPAVTIMGASSPLILAMQFTDHYDSDGCDGFVTGTGAETG